MNIDQVMINHMLGVEEVGQFAAAVKISTVWYFVPTVISSSLFPAIINAKKVSEHLYYTRLQRLYDLMVWMAIAIAIPMTFLSDWEVNLLYGQQYNQAGRCAYDSLCRNSRSRTSYFNIILYSCIF